MHCERLTYGDRNFEARTLDLNDNREGFAFACKGMTEFMQMAMPFPY